MNEHFNRRNALGLILAGAAAFATGCSSPPRNGRVGQPLPGTSAGGASPAPSQASTASGSSEAEEALRAWRERSNGANANLGEVVPRSAWATAGPNASLARPMGRIERITVHHDGMDEFDSFSRQDAARRVEAIRRAHVNNGWADIGYHYIIDPAGRIYEGRPVSLQGAHVRDANERNLGVMVLGNFMRRPPTEASVSSLEGFLRSAMRQYRVPVQRVMTHREYVPTACPGDRLQTMMNQLRGSRSALG